MTLERPIQSAFKEFERLFQQRLTVAEKFGTLHEVQLLIEAWDLAQKLGLPLSHRPYSLNTNDSR